MCLTISTDAELLTAEEDIICYKYLLAEDELLTDDLKTGDKFTAIINDISCEGVIVVDIDENDLYLCTNNKEMEGAVYELPTGYKYSWVLDYNVRDVLINGEQELKYEKTFITPFQGAEVKLGETYHSEIVKRFSYAVYEGLHSFKTLDYDQIDEDDIIVKCIIPKGSKYYVGEFDGTVSFASNKIKYVEIIKREEDGK